MVRKKRWALLKHLGSPDDSIGLHFDLLLEESINCRTWRLDEIPVLDGPAFNAKSIQAHKLTWLEITEKEVSGARGIATRISHGQYSGILPVNNDDLLIIHLEGDSLHGLLEIDKGICRLSSIEHKSTTRVSKHP